MDIRNLRYRLQRHRDYERWKTMVPRQRTANLDRLARMWKISSEEMAKAWTDLENGWPESELGEIPETEHQLRVQEYEAFRRDWGRMEDWERFQVRDQTDAWRDHVAEKVAADGAMIDRVVAVDRLREVRAFRGFRRLGAAESVLVPPDLTKEESWTPAVELHGEGIFFTLDESRLAAWEKQSHVQARAQEMQRRFAENPLPGIAELLGGDPSAEDSNYISPRFLLLHTLAHLMIRQLEFQAGVSAASIRERLYCSTGGNGEPMAGVLLYTVSSDLFGSLAGLGVLAEPESFLRLLRTSIKHGKWCSFDPVCAEHEGSGPGELNRAACHGCCLLPEPSCEFQNCLLDRTFVVTSGPTGAGSCGFFDGALT